MSGRPVDGMVGTGALLDDPRDPRCTEWLVEIPTKTVWADLE